MTLYKDRRVEDYEYNAKTGFTDCEQGEKMNGVKDERKQVAQKSVELTLAIDCLESNIRILEDNLEKVIQPCDHKEDPDIATEQDLVPLARFLELTKNRVTRVAWLVEGFINRLEL